MRANLKFLSTAQISTAIFVLSFSVPVFAKSERLEKVGDVGQYGIPLIAGAVSLYHLDGEGLLELGEGAIWTALSTHLLKSTVDATRPDGTDQSFPSAHTASAAQGAAYLQFRYGYQYGIPAYIAAGVVGYSRIDANRHHWRDVFAGLALGTGVQYLISEQSWSMTELAIVPYLESKGVGVAVSFRY